MYELIQVTDHDYYIESPAKIGLVKLNDTDVILIDSGNDKGAGRKVRQILDKNNWNLKAIYNTHAHADHIGGNRYLQNQKKCPIYLTEIEETVAKNPYLEAFTLIGATPPKDLQHKFLKAEESNASLLTEDVLPDGFSIIELPGHAFNMVGFRTPDNTIYLADALSSRETIDKYKINFLVSPKEYVETLEKVKELEADHFIPAHAPACEEIVDLAQYNIDKVYEIRELLKEILAEPLVFDEILKRVYDHFGMELSVEQYALVGSTIRSYLNWLRDDGEIEFIIDNNQLKYKVT